MGRVHFPVSKDILVEVEHVEAHRTKKDKKEMSHLRSLSPMAMRKRMSWQGRYDVGRRICGGSEGKNGAARERDFCSLQFAASILCLVQSRSRSQKKSGFSWITKGKKRNIGRSGVLRATNTVA